MRQRRKWAVFWVTSEAFAHLVLPKWKRILVPKWKRVAVPKWKHKAENQVCSLQILSSIFKSEPGKKYNSNTKSSRLSSDNPNLLIKFMRHRKLKRYQREGLKKYCPSMPFNLKIFSPPRPQENQIRLLWPVAWEHLRTPYGTLQIWYLLSRRVLPYWRRIVVPKWKRVAVPKWKRKVEDYILCVYYLAFGLILGRVFFIQHSIKCKLAHT